MGILLRYKDASIAIAVVGYVSICDLNDGNRILVFLLIEVERFQVVY